jgi:hypothetical protein
VADGPPAAILADTALLVAANLIHEHLHAHGELAHSHPHEPADGHHVEPVAAAPDPSSTPVR